MRVCSRKGKSQARSTNAEQLSQSQKETVGGLPRRSRKDMAIGHIVEGSRTGRIECWIGKMTLAVTRSPLGMSKSQAGSALVVSFAMTGSLRLKARCRQRIIEARHARHGCLGGHFYCERGAATLCRVKSRSPKLPRNYDRTGGSHHAPTPASILFRPPGIPYDILAAAPVWECLTDWPATIRLPARTGDYRHDPTATHKDLTVAARPHM
jgi:hypothetical protein